MAFKKIFPRRGTVIPEEHRPPGSLNAALHELPAYREHVHDLKGVVLYLPEKRFVVVPTRHVGSGGMYVTIVHGDDTYPRGGYDIDCSEWELQRAMRVVLDIHPIDTPAVGYSNRPGVALAETADGLVVKVLREEPVVVEPEPGAFDEHGRCRLCGEYLPTLLLHRTGEGVQCANFTACAERSRANRVRPDERVHCRKCGVLIAVGGKWGSMIPTADGPACKDELACSGRVTSGLGPVGDGDR